MVFPVPSYTHIVNWHEQMLENRDGYLVDSIYIFVSWEYGTNFSSRETAHAQTKYQDNSTSGRCARASYQTMLPEISARRSLL